MIVSGLVQGVFFRDTCRREAVGHAIAGWVRNRPDGTVEAVFEGPADRVEQMVAWAHQGPSRAVVTHVTAHTEPPEGLSGFAIY